MKQSDAGDTEEDNKVQWDEVRKETGRESLIRGSRSKLLHHLCHRSEPVDDDEDDSYLTKLSGLHHC